MPFKIIFQKFASNCEYVDGTFLTIFDVKGVLISESVPNDYPKLHLFWLKIQYSDFEDGDKVKGFEIKPPTR